MSSSHLSCAARLLLRCVGNVGNSFPRKQGRIPHLALEVETELLWRSPDARASSGVQTGMSGNFLSCKNGVKDPLEVPEVRCEYPRNASAEMVLVSPGGENLLDFLELRQLLSTYDGNLRDPL